ncbi:MAG: VanW family protein [Candidatus Woesebacteria bacterium]
MTKVSQSTVFISLFCVSAFILIISWVLIFSPFSSSEKAPRPLPTTISLFAEDETFSTPSASLVSGAANIIDHKKASEWIGSISAVVTIASDSPRIVYDKKTTKLSVSAGKRGRTVDATATLVDVLDLPNKATDSAKLTLIETGKELTPDTVIASEKRARSYLGKQLTLQTGTYKKILKDTDLFTLLDLPEGYSSDAITVLSQLVDKDIATPPTEPALTIENNKVTEFVAPKDGIGLNTIVFEDTLSQALGRLEQNSKVDPVEIPLITTSPNKKLSELNSLGIEEIIGKGNSTYFHSIPNRVHNVSLTASKIHSTLILPGETFSFNKALGDVSAATGFKQAYVIKQGQTVLGDGGGVCQVSSTMFRALLDAGLPITERRGHAYRVGYYEQNSKPGFDATVYDPHPDLRFVNDTGHAILINTQADPKTLSMYIELWGKMDGRKAAITNYKQWDAVQAPPPVYQDDPTLKPGEVKQIDYAAPGLKTSFDYTVTYPNGNVKAQTFKTTYTPWAAVYMRGI